MSIYQHRTLRVELFELPPKTSEIDSGAPSQLADMASRQRNKESIEHHYNPLPMNFLFVKLNHHLLGLPSPPSS
jgi:hypothetical protein